jgi:transcriptional regulator with XRE-family HTH domain
MAHIRVSPRLRMYRRQWQLTLRELASLLGFKSGAHVSRLEQGKRTPSLETALACTAIFGATLEELFPESLRHTRATLKGRATRFRKGQEHSITPVSERKCDLMDEVLIRVGAHKSTEV